MAKCTEASKDGKYLNCVLARPPVSFIKSGNPAPVEDGIDQRGRSMYMFISEGMK